MANLSALDGQRITRFLAASGTGTDLDPFRIAHTVSPETITVRSPSLSTVSTAGTIASGCVSVSVANTGSANGTLLGQTIAPGVVIDLVAPWGDTIAAISYDATGTSFLIQELR